jgi:hypothetical protein
MSKSIKTSLQKKNSSKNVKNVTNTKVLAVYDFTSYNIDLVTTKSLLKQYCKKWVFQLEECPTTKKNHYQGRFSLKVRERISGVRIKFPGFHISITSNESTKNDFYVTKEDTRIDGPWKDDDEEIYIPRQVRNIVELHPWQQKIINNSLRFNTRSINVLLDTSGNIGKSTFTTYCGVYKLGRKVPYCDDFRDIMRMVMDTPTSKLYIFDIPRAIKKEKLVQFYAGIEEIKNGYAFDDRYKFREKYFDCPSVWVFTNVIPDVNLFSGDRWKLWEVIDNDLSRMKI